MRVAAAVSAAWPGFKINAGYHLGAHKIMACGVAVKQTASTTAGLGRKPIHTSLNLKAREPVNLENSLDPADDEQAD
jgi:hypothetical protein